MVFPLAHRAARLAVLAAVLALAAIGATAPRAEAALQVGIMDPAYASADPHEYWADIARLRPRFLRYDLHWNEVAPTKPAKQRDPADPAYRWGYFDDLMRDAAAHGYRGCDVIVTVWRTPPWASTVRGNTNYANAPNLQQWRNFVYAAATRYSGYYDPDGPEGPLETLPQVACWEIWNEPNFNGALRPQRTGKQLTSAITYVRMLNAAYAEIHAATRRFGVRPQIIGGALYRAVSTKGIGPIRFMQEMKKRGARFDVLSIHPYNGTPALGIRDGTGVGTRWPSISIGNFQRFINEVNRLWRGRKLPIWITEYGWQSKSGRKDQYAVTEAQQARFLAQSIDVFRRKYKRVGRITWFLIKDESPARSSSWQSGFRRLNHTAKPSFFVWQRLAGVVKKPPQPTTP